MKHGVGEVTLPFEEMSLTPEQLHLLGNLRLQLIDLSRRLEQDVNEDVADYVLFRLQQALNHLSRLAASVDVEVFHEVQTSLAQVTTVLADAERNWQPTYPAVNTARTLRTELESIQ